MYKLYSSNFQMMKLHKSQTKCRIFYLICSSHLLILPRYACPTCATPGSQLWCIINFKISHGIETLMPLNQAPQENIHDRQSSFVAYTNIHKSSIHSCSCLRVNTWLSVPAIVPTWPGVLPACQLPIYYSKPGLAIIPTTARRQVATLQ